jgi:hypothetical protein
MTKSCWIVAVASLLPLWVLAAPDGGHDAPIEVMVLSSFHMMGGDNGDLVLVRPRDVLSEAMQTEIASVIDGLAAFQPTVVAVERIAKDQTTLVDHVFVNFRPEQLRKERDERVQLGFRLATQAKTSRVFAIDIHNGFPFAEVEAWAKANQRHSGFLQEQEALQKVGAEFQRSLKTDSLVQTLVKLNTAPFLGNDMYYQMLSYGSGDAWPGVDLASRWFERNALIFGRLMKVARPGDRIVVVYGAGHHFLLKHFVENTPGYRYVSPLPFLKAVKPPALAK